MKPAVRIAEKDFLPRQDEPRKNGQLPAKARRKAEPQWADELAKKVEENLWSRLPLARWLRLGFSNLGQVVEIYIASVQELRIAREQGNAFFREVCRANFEVRCADAADSSAREAIARQEMAAFQGSIKLPSASLDRTLRADLACVDLAIATRQLVQALRRQTHAFVQQFVAACKNAVGREIIGVVEWRKEFVACVLHFFRRVVVLGETKKQTKTSRKKVKRLAGRHGYATVTEEITIRSGTDYEVRHAQHE